MRERVGGKVARLNGKELSRRDLAKLTGDISQIAGAKEYELLSGKSKGVRAVDVRTGSGFSFTVLPDRGMDIACAEYKGTSLSFISKTGIVSPAYYNEQGFGFLRSFYAGLLTTCGISHMGAPCVDQGENLGLHGRASNTPAENVAVYSEWTGDEFLITLRGTVRESRVFGENLTLERKIVTSLGSNILSVRDKVENCGFEPQPLMLLYHCNFGYPLLSSESVLIKPGGTVRPRDAEAQKGLEECHVFCEPQHGYAEQVFYHDLKADEKGETFACLFNSSLGTNGLGAYVRFNKNELPYLIEWKQMGEGDYVAGLEPGSWYPEGRAEARKRGELQFIQPGETREFHLEIGVVESRQELPKII
jgi:hypothetical protein